MSNAASLQLRLLNPQPGSGSG